MPTFKRRKFLVFFVEIQLAPPQAEGCSPSMDSLDCGDGLLNDRKKKGRPAERLSKVDTAQCLRINLLLTNPELPWSSVQGRQRLPLSFGFAIPHCNNPPVGILRISLLATLG